MVSTSDCSICLEKCVQPVQLPCGHIFCFLCVKGVADIFRKCANCRKPIPTNYFDNPAFLPTDGVTVPVFDGCYQWFYEGKDGWWVYDSRTSQDLENAYKSGAPQCQLLIAGRLYYIDFQAMVQYRSDEPRRKRSIKRDPILSTKIKGVAGVISILSPNSQISPQRTPQGQAQTPQRPTSLPTSSSSQSQAKESSNSPSAPVLSPNSASRPSTLFNNNGSPFVDLSSSSRSHNTRGDPLYRCNTCRSSFPSSDALKAHENSHDQGHSCGVCGDTFRSHRSLNVHERIHESSSSQQQPNYLNYNGQSSSSSLQKKSLSDNPFDLRRYTKSGNASNERSKEVESDHDGDDEDNGEEDNRSQPNEFDNDVASVIRPFAALNIAKRHNRRPA